MIILNLYFSDSRNILADLNCALFLLEIFTAVKVGADMSANSFWIRCCVDEAYLHKRGCHCST